MRCAGGSSPRMRGALRLPAVAVFDHGIIPAYAGSTLSYCGDNLTDGDHPRVCGEHVPHTVIRLLVRGSSPRMRGAPHVGGAHRGRQGIIPAYAGSTMAMIIDGIWIGDHPRVCGEHPSNWPDTVKQRGSSPRMRGAQRRTDFRGPVFGIIPAYAGSTPPMLPPCRIGWDHPRVCGEHAHDDALADLEPGSSPRMRGAHCDSRRLHCLAGIIPAYAGSTLRNP